MITFDFLYQTTSPVELEKFDYEQYFCTKGSYLNVGAARYF